MSYAVDVTPSAEESSIVGFLRRALEREWPTTRARDHALAAAAGRGLWERLRDWDMLCDAGAPAMCLAHEELGAGLAPGHTWGANLAGIVLRAAGHPLADAMAAGELRITAAVPVGDMSGDAADLLVVEPDGADRVLYVGAQGAVVLSTPDTAEVPAADASRRFGALRGHGGRELLDADADAIEAFWRAGMLTAAADSLGACRRLVEASCSYARDRVQFGRPVAAFQAVSHRLVDMDAALAIARAAVHRAAVLVSAAAPDAEEATRVAKAATGAAVRKLSRDAVQVHGAIGFTWEHDLHLWARRAYVSDRLFGSGTRHDRALAAALAQPTAERSPW